VCALRKRFAAQAEIHPGAQLSVIILPGKVQNKVSRWRPERTCVVCETAAFAALRLCQYQPPPAAPSATSSNGTGVRLSALIAQV
jgi:hypothetical protein